MNGKIICIDGTDGCGKQTQTKILVDYLKSIGKNVILQSFPNYQYDSSIPVKMYLSGEFGDNANCLDAYQASVLFGVDRLLTYNKFLKSHYENGGYIVFDRYTTSNMIHQAGKIQDDNELDKFLNWLNDFEFNYLKLPKPDIVIFLDVPVHISKKLADSRKNLKNMSQKDIHEQDVNHLLHAYNCGLKVAKKYNWEIIDCTQNDNLLSINDISSLIIKKIDKVL